VSGYNSLKKGDDADLLKEIVGDGVGEREESGVDKLGVDDNSLSPLDSPRFGSSP